MICLGALVLAAALAPRADAHSPSASELAPDVRLDAAGDPYADADLRPVSFEVKAVHASTRRVVSPDLRDPFRIADAKPRKKLRLHEDLRDPFAGRRGAARSGSPADLRDPFDGVRAKCPAVSEDGVKIQRPKALRRPGCEAARADRPTRIARR